MGTLHIPGFSRECLVAGYNCQESPLKHISIAYMSLRPSLNEQMQFIRNQIKSLSNGQGCEPVLTRLIIENPVKFPMVATLLALADGVQFDNTPDGLDPTKLVYAASSEKAIKDFSANVAPNYRLIPVSKTINIYNNGH